MSFADQVHHLRNTANADLIAELIANIPQGEAIEPRDYLHEVLIPELSACDEARLSQIPEVLDQYQAELDRQLARYHQLRTEGLSALSDYDIGIAYRGIGPEAGLACALRLLANHIALSRAQIRWLLDEQARLTPPQMALF